MWAEVGLFLVRDADGAPLHFITHERDITGRRRTQAALRDSEERFRAAFERYRTFIDATDDLVFLKDEEFRYLIVNRAQAEFFGRAEDEIIGRTDVELMPSDDATAWLQSDRAASGSHRPVLAEEIVGDRHFEFRKFRVDLGEGRVGVGGYARDISERRRAKAALQESERRFREMTDLLPDMVFELNCDRRFTYINRAFSRTLGYTQADLDAGVDADDILDEETLARAG